MKSKGVLKQVENWLDNADDKKTMLKDLLQHGCASGLVGDLIYYKDTSKFYDKHRKEILEMVEDYCNQTGENLQSFLSHANNFPLSKEELKYEALVNGIGGLIRKNKDLADQIKNWLAWFAFEQRALEYYAEKYESVS